MVLWASQQQEVGKGMEAEKGQLTRGRAWWALETQPELAQEMGKHSCQEHDLGPEEHQKMMKLLHR